MKLRNTIILLVVLVVLGGYAWYISNNNVAPITGAATGTPAPTPVVMFDVVTDKVNKFQVTDLKKNLTVSVTRQGDNWHMDQPKDSDTDLLKIDSTLSQLSHLEATRVLTNTTDLGQFGLTSPSIQATMVLTDSTQFVLKIGDETPDKADYYALKGDDKTVYLISASIGQALIDYLDQPPYPPTPTPTPLPSLTPTATPPPGTGTPEATATPTP